MQIDDWQFSLQAELTVPVVSLLHVLELTLTIVLHVMDKRTKQLIGMFQL